MDVARVALHPEHPRGVEEALAAIDGVELVMPAIDEIVGAAPILVTFHWSDAYLSSDLRWVQSISAGVDQYPLTRMQSAGVVLTSARGVHAIPVAEHALALLLALTRGVGVAMRDAEHKRWRPRMGQELAGRTAAVLGLGTIGTAVAERLAALGIRVIGTRNRPELGHPIAELVHGPDGTMDVCRLADIVVSTLPGGSATRHEIGTAELEALGRGWVVNVGRGSTIDQEAVVEALESGSLRGVGLDVFESEPLPASSPLWSHPRVVITPHVGGFSPAYGVRLAQLLTTNLDAFMGRGEWVNRVV